MCHSSDEKVKKLASICEEDALQYPSVLNPGLTWVS